MEVQVTKRDVLFGYFAQIFNYGTGVIVLPVILNKLSAEEIGMNYVMLSVGALASMADFGFSGQIGRNVTYVLSGAKKIYRNEIETIEKNDKVDFKLLKTIVDASKFLYKRLSIVVLFLLLTLGTLYMYHITEGFSNVANSLPIWIVFAVSTYFNLYYLYYNSLLTGAGLVMEQKLATIYSKITYIVICFALIFSGCGLISVVIANLISPFVARYYSYRKFYSEEMRSSLPKDKSNKDEVKEALSDIWATAKKSGTNTIGHYVGTQGSTFIAGAYLPLAVTAQWGLMVQLFGVVQGIASNMAMSYYPEYCKQRLRGDNKAFIRLTSLSITSMIALLVTGGLAIIVLCPWLINILGSDTTMPSVSLMFAYLLYLVVLSNAQIFAMMMSARNVIVSPVAVLSTSAAQILLTIALLQFTNIGIWALLLGPAISGCAYTLWKWMVLELKEMNLSILAFYSIGIKETKSLSNRLIRTLLGPKRTN